MKATFFNEENAADFNYYLMYNDHVITTQLESQEFSVSFTLRTGTSENVKSFIRHAAISRSYDTYEQ